MSLPGYMMIDVTTCVIQRLIVDPDHLLGSAPGVFSVVGSDVVCALDRSMSMSNIYGGIGRETSIQGESNHESYKLFVLPTQDIISGDKMIVGTVEYKVTDVISFSSHKESMLSLWS